MKLRLLTVLFLGSCASSWAAVGGCLTAVNCVQFAQNTQVWSQFFGNTLGQATGTILRLQNPTQAGNTLAVACQVDNAANISSIADDGSDTFTAGHNTNDTGNGERIIIYYALNIAASTHKITVTWNASTDFHACSAMELYHVANAAIDGNNGNFGSGTAATAGSITPSVSGDIFFMCVESSATSFAPTSNAHVTWHLLSGDVLEGMACQVGIEDGTTTAVNAGMTLSSSTWGAAAVAFKVDNSRGAAPPAGIYVASVLTVDLGFDTNSHSGSAGYSTAQNVLLPCSGNLLAASMTGQVANKVNSISSDSNSNTWTVNATAANNVSYTQWMYAQNATCSDTEHFTVNFAGDSGPQTLKLFDIRGAATSAFCTIATNTGTQSSPGNLTAVSITPCAANGLVMAATGIAFNTASGTTTSGGNFISGFNVNPKYGSTVVTDGPWPNDENNAWAILYNSTTSAVSWVWTFQFSGTCQGSANCSVGDWAALAIAFSPPAAATNKMPPAVF